MVRVRKPQYAGETQLASFCKLFDIHIYPAHNYQLLSGHWGQFRNSNQGRFFFHQSSIVKENILLYTTSGLIKLHPMQSLEGATSNS